MSTQYHTNQICSTIDDFLPDQAGENPWFRLKDRFYGRDRELSRLHRFFLKNGNACGLALVSGVSGIGKTAFVRAFCQGINKAGNPVVPIICGKYDQVRQDIPYSALADALRQFVHQSMAQSDPVFKALQDNIKKALGGNGRLMTDMIPELEWIIGPQPRVSELNILETRNRFIATFIRFLRAVCKKTGKVFLFLDDLQWIDAGSLTLLEAVLEQGIPGFFIIGAFRREEVDSSHRLYKVIDAVHGTGIPVEKISIGPLSQAAITRMLAGSSNTGVAAAGPLAEIIRDRSCGNPFFIKEYVRSLFHFNYLKYDLARNNWEWDIRRIKEMNTRTSMQELTRTRILALDPSLTGILEKAACLGNAFDCRDLALACDLPLSVINASLKQAVLHELIVADKKNDGKDGAPHPGTYGFKFVHDGIQLCFYDLIPGEKRAAEHYRIGKKLYNTVQTKKKDGRLMDAAGQMNLGKSAVTDKKEQHALAKINLAAAREARTAAAYHTALSYAATGISLLGDTAWQTRYDLTLALYNEIVEVCFLCLKFNEVEDYGKKILDHARTPLDKMKAYEIFIIMLGSRKIFNRAIETGIDALAQLGEKPPVTPRKGQILAAYLRTRISMFNRPPAVLEHLPPMEDPRALAAIRIYSQSATVAFAAAPMLVPLYMLHCFLLTLKYGNPPFAPFVYAMYSMILCGITGDVPLGLEYARLALKLLEKDEFKSLAVKTRLIINCYATQWQHHPKNDLDQMKQGLELGLADGDFEYAAFSIHMYNGHRFYCGRPLSGLDLEMRRGSQEIRTLGQDAILNINLIFHQAVLNLLGRSADPCCLEGEVYSEKKMFPQYVETGNTNALCIANLNKMLLCCLFYRFEDARKCAGRTEANLDSVTGLSLVPWFYFYDALVHLAAYENADPKSRKKFLSRISATRKRLKKWTKIIPVNYEHRYLLVEAETARIKGKKDLAADLYNRAADAAQKNDYIHEEALAWELAAKFYDEQDRSTIAAVYLDRALACYEKWGAVAKIAHLEKHFSHLLSNNGRHLCFHSPPGLQKSASIDLAALTRASEAIAKETVIIRLMDKLMAIVLENAGAQKGSLLFKTSGIWQVEARVDVEKDKRFRPVPLEECPDLPHALIRYARRTGRDIVLAHAAEDPGYEWDPYVRKEKLKSALCIPISHQEKISGVLYLENNNLTGVFTPEKIEVLKSVARILANARARNLAEEKIIDYQDQLRSLSSQLLLVEEKERRRMAVALHDTIGHGLSSLAMAFEKLKKQTRNPNQDRFDTIRSIIDESIKATRTLTFELSPPVLYDLGLGAALDWLAEKTEAQHGIRVRFMDIGTSANIDESSAVLIFQSVRELLFNMVKHAHAIRAEVLMKTDESDLMVVVKDNGRGFDPSGADLQDRAKGGFGLFSIHERLGSRGGYMEIDSNPGRGTKITLVLPLETAPEPAS